MNLIMLLEMAAEAMGDRIAVGSRLEGTTYNQLLQQASTAAAGFRAANVDRVLLCDESSPAVPAALFGAAWAAIPYAPLNYRLADDDLRSLAQRGGPAIAITNAHTGLRLSGIDTIETIDRDVFLTTGSESMPESAWSMDPEEIAIILFTSGTTGPPKSAILRHRHLVSYIVDTVDFMGAAEDEATLVSVPPYHVAGVASVLSSVYAGRRIVQLPTFDPDQWIDTVLQEGITHAMVVPTMLTRIVDAIEARGGEPLLGVRTLAYGGGRMPPQVIRHALELFPITSFVNAYGLTETSSTISLLGPDDHRVAQYSDDPSHKRRLASVGRPLPGIDVAVRDPHGTDLPIGSVGEIFVRGTQVAGEYLEKGSTLIDGWFPTRDNGYVDEFGYLFLQGRNDDVIVRGGENISPGEIEDALLAHHGVTDAAAIGVPCREWGEKVVVVVLADAEPPSESELRDHVRTRLGSSRAPAHVVFIDELPYNDTGKLLRRVLRADYSHLGDGPAS